MTAANHADQRKTWSLITSFHALPTTDYSMMLKMEPYYANLVMTGIMEPVFRKSVKLLRNSAKTKRKLTFKRKNLP